MPDRDDDARSEATKTLNKLLSHYWRVKNANPPADFDELYDLRKAYEDAYVEYAALEARLLRDDILTTPSDLVTFRRVREKMAEAVETKEILEAARAFIKLIIAIA